LSIDIATMADTKNEHNEPDILDLVDHAMGANPDPPEAFAGAKLLSSVRTRVLREGPNTRPDAHPHRGIEAAQLALYGSATSIR
jgi:hypothetical protein